MPVDNTIITFIFILHIHPIAHRAEIISQVQKASRPDATHNDLFLLIHKATKIIKLLAGNLIGQVSVATA